MKKLKYLNKLDKIDLEILECALCVYKGDMCKPKHHTKERISAMRYKIEVLRDKGE